MSRPYPVGVSTTGSVPDDLFFRAIAEAGIRAFEYSEPPALFGAIPFSEVVASARRWGVEPWSFHLPFLPFAELDPSSTDEEKRVRTVSRLAGIMREAAPCGFPRFVIHPSAEPIPDEERPARLAASEKSLAELAGVAASLGATLCVEDLPRTCLANTPDELLDLLSADPRLRVCFDVNHLLKNTHREFLDKLGDKIVTLHISDYDFLDEKHWLPGEGSIDWQGLLAGLDTIGYRGAFLYEVSPACPKTLRRRDLTARDYARNAEELFAGKAPTVIGDL